MSSDPNIGVGDQPAEAEPRADKLPTAEVSDVKFTRAGALWVSLILGFLVLIVLLIFITQNTESTEFAFLTWRWTLPLGVAILLSAVLGGLITALVSAARMFQLRRTAKKNLQAALKR
ncbi:MAG TPA: lipopolysaccharide assembly protein LapA domain-containing protein [Mycobacterium sp.]|nr:lipopolysaccharide assembly protein LapA domain-containing protein [Mycobacterium sp.]HPZ94490.1 lipopolysaccharide assembly protein LapA domain-containing protein [Mycobacterium sp.]HQE14919.1 lipopolysaccharide assembly protein LapA domain-containing protein [Mycobacterium sp.]